MWPPLAAERWVDVGLCAWGSQGSRHVVNEERWTRPLPVLSMDVAGTRVVEREAGHCYHGCLGLAGSARHFRIGTLITALKHEGARTMPLVSHPLPCKLLAGALLFLPGLCLSLQDVAPLLSSSWTVGRDQRGCVGNWGMHV